VRTRVGYTGGTKKDPTYHDLGDHTESFQVDYDPTVTSYAKLLKVFWASHNPCEEDGSTQYMSAVFWHDAVQKKLAEETRDAEQVRRGAKIKTALLPVGTFYLAEDYHQKYFLRLHTQLFKEFQAIYPTKKDLYHSTAVARVNGYLGGHGSSVSLLKEIAGYGLSPAARATLVQLVKGVK
jgi:peptide-methionine (S)-S-oxide reductase